jgi:hypothetical protein
MHEHGSAPGFNVVKHFVRRQSIRTMDWLDTYGYCQDHLRPGLSSIRQAGWGAFASRDMPAGTIVGYSPLIHMGVHGRDVYWVTYPGAADPIQGKPKRRYDLILNYSFGHKNSTVLLTPYGGMVNYINHQPKGKANVKIRWPDRELVAHKPWWLDREPGQLRDTTEKIGLSFEYVALRDIKEGEEVFMDYGGEWEAAWNDHVAKWHPLQDGQGYVHRSDWPEEHIRTIHEDKYPDNLVTVCIESYTTGVPTGGEGSDNGSKLVNTWVTPMTETSTRVYCRALTRRKDDQADSSDGDEVKYLYEVELNLEVDGKETSVVVEDIPETGIFLVDRAYSQDWHLPNVFRHEIMVPDDVMPSAWLNGPAPSPPEGDEDAVPQYPIKENGENDDEEDDDD